MNTLIVFLEGDRMKASRVAGTPKTLRVGRNTFKVSGSLGDFDYLRDRAGNLIGFVFDVGEREIRLLSQILARAKNLTLAKGRIFLFLTEEPAYQTESVQASSWLYRGPKGAQLIGLHEWKEFGHCAFDVRDLCR